MYPEGYGGSGEANRRVKNAYNAQGRLIWREDQTGLIVESDYDTGGRLTARRATTLDGAGTLDTDVLRISTTYNSRGLVDLVGQYSSATVGSGTLLSDVASLCPPQQPLPHAVFRACPVRPADPDNIQFT